ncbi:MAG: SpoIVB peptidase [Clostridiales bacterium]|nr:SpoIVB peptidase [Clostridiales bacterium]
MKKQFYSLLAFLLVFCFVVGIVSPVCTIFQIEDGFLADYSDIDTVNENKTFGSLIKTELNEKENAVGGEKTKQGEVVFKLFGFIPIKKVSVVMNDDKDYYVGGVPIGLSINSEGAIVVNDELNRDCLREGDIITKINGKEIGCLSNVEKLLENSENEVEIEYIRKNKPIKTLLKTSKDENSGRFKLGLWVKDDVSGVGTLTFVEKDSHKYGALGHPIVEANSGNIVPVAGGEVYRCNLIGINKGKKNNPGELKCVFLSNHKSKGTIEDNSKFGISGVLQDLEGLIDQNKTAKLGGRLAVKMGDAKIVSTISGIREEYDIEIIKANYQKSAKDKSIVFRVTDDRLLSLTGGIVQGMSGSPIIQDGKIVGAVTHVFLNDPTKGYGVYTDWMVDTN